MKMFCLLHYQTIITLKTLNLKPLFYVALCSQKYPLNSTLTQNNEKWLSELIGRSSVVFQHLVLLKISVQSFSQRGFLLRGPLSFNLHETVGKSIIN